MGHFHGPRAALTEHRVVPPGVEVRTADQADFFVSKAALDPVVRGYEQEDTERFASLGTRFVFAGAEGLKMGATSGYGSIGI